MYWSEKHQDLAIENGWWQSSLNIANYIIKITRGDSAVEIEFDANKFQKRMTKLRGKPYHRTTIRKCIYQLDEQSEGLIVVMRDYGRGIYKLLVRPISFVTENRKAQKENSHRQNAGKPMFSEEQKKKLALQQQQDISKIKCLTENVGLRYDGNALDRIWRFSGKCVEEVKNALKLLLYRHSKGTEKIDNPNGFLIRALQYGWSKDLNLYYEPELPKFTNRMAIDTFVNGLSQKNRVAERSATT